MAAPVKEPAPSDEPVPTEPESGNPNTDLDHPQGGSPGLLPPTAPKPEDYPPILEAPEAVDPTAVETVSTVEGDKKYGWQNPSPDDFTETEPCVHMGTVEAKKQIRYHELGHEWVCTCGTIFVVAINSGGKKTLVPKADAVEVVVPLPVVTP